MPARDHVFHAGHLEGVVGARGDAHLAARAVHGRGLDAEAQAGHLVASRGLADVPAPRRLLELLVRGQERADHRVGADGGTLVALRALVEVHHRHAGRHPALRPLRHAELDDSAGLELAHGDGVSVAAVDLVQHLRDIGGHLGPAHLGEHRHGHLARQRDVPVVRQVHREQLAERHVDGVDVLPDHLGALALVSLVDSLLEHRDRQIRVHHLGQVEENSLHDVVDHAPHPSLACYTGRIDVVQDEAFGFDVLPERERQVLLQEIGGRPGRVENQNAPGLEAAQHGLRRQRLHVLLLVDPDVLRPRGDLVTTLDGLGPKAQEGTGDAAGLERVVGEVALRVQVRLLGNEFDGILVRAHGPVGAEPVQHALGGALGHRVHRSVLQAQESDVVLEADREWVLRLRLRQVLEDGVAHARGEVLAREAVTATDDPDVLRRRDAEEGCAHVGVERLPEAGLLAAVQHGHAPRRLRHRGEEVLRTPGAVEVHLHDADLPARAGVVQELLHDLRTAAHDDHHVGGVRVADVLEDVVRAACQLLHPHHGRADRLGHGVVVLVGTLHVLKEDISTLCGAAQGGMIGVKGLGAERVDLVLQLVHHDLDVILGNRLALLDFVRGAHAVEEVDEGHGAQQRRDVSHERHVQGLLDAVRGQKGHASLAHCHDV
mmetsp:Transcript_105986/g.279771  ORF Transcript_105986/g.279771 Transcript_105986/m.279771 type:complete len:659 (-) Transcript_105986:580-2556(-)